MIIDFKGPSLRGIVHKQEGTRATLSSFQGRLQTGHEDDRHREVGRLLAPETLFTPRASEEGRNEGFP